MNVIYFISKNMNSVVSYTVSIDKSTLDEKVGIALRTDEAGTRIAKLRPNTPASISLLKEGDKLMPSWMVAILNFESK